MSKNLVIRIRLHEGRYHGMGDMPPAPARLYQALVAGAARGAVIDNESRQALEWLETMRPPTVASPAMRTGQRVEPFVPNNDMDVDGLRVSKTIVPKLFDARTPLLYVWALDGGDEEATHTHAICGLAERLYQFGRGVDMAWAWGEVVDDEELDAQLSDYPGLVYRPSVGGSGRTLACPEPGSLGSIEARYAANSQRFHTEGQGKAARQLFSQPPKSRFTHVPYESPPSRRVYELRTASADTAFGVWPLARASRLVVWLRDAAVERLRRALPDRSSEIDRVLVGRKADGADEGPTSARVKIVPLPSIGHQHADRGIRRLLIEVPAGCPVRADDVYWAFSGLDLIDPMTGEVLDLVLTPSDDESMLGYYGGGDRDRFRVWRTVTPAALPVSVRRRRIDPARMAAEAKDGVERSTEQACAAGAVIQALRHVEERTKVEAVRVQREPFEAKGERVEAFSLGTRFAKERLWHVEITFGAPIAGPIVIGDGRFLGLGVMAPVPRHQAVHSFAVTSGLAATAQPAEIARSLRRAVMARVQEALGARTALPAFFSGHERDGSPTRTERCPHVTFLFDPGHARLLVVAPHVLDRRPPTQQEEQHLRELDSALTEFRELLAGSAGRLTLCTNSVDTDADPLFAASRTWESVTPYQVTRHAKGVGAAEALAADLRAECRRRGLPEPRVTPLESHGVSGIGLVGSARLTFEVAVKGPVVLGRSRYLGGGLFKGRAT